jgi:hypothetical protein
MLFFPVLLPIPVRIFSAAFPPRSAHLAPSSEAAFRSHAHDSSRALKTPLHLRLSMFFRMNTCKSVSKQGTLTTFRMNTYEKTGGRGIHKKLTSMHAVLSHQSPITSRYSLGRASSGCCGLRTFVTVHVHHDSTCLRGGDSRRHHVHSARASRHFGLPALQNTRQTSSRRLWPQVPIAHLPPRLPRARRHSRDASRRGHHRSRMSCAAGL